MINIRRLKNFELDMGTGGLIYSARKPREASADDWDVLLRLRSLQKFDF